MKRTVRSLATVLVIAIAMSAMAIQTASARQRYPVIGCYDLTINGFNHYLKRYKPSGLCSITVTTASIDHTHWKHWGAKRATAHGDCVDSLGFMYAANITAYDLRVVNIAGVYNLSYYGHVHLVSRGGYRGGVFRGPFHLTFNTTPDI